MKKAIAPTLLAIAIIGLVAWLANYLSTGKIIIEAGEGDTVTLQKTSSGKPFTKVAVNSVSATVKHGQYTATVKNGSKTTTQIIDFNSGHKMFRYSMHLVDLLKVEPVTYQGAQDLDVTASQLIYLDTSSRTLFKINNQNYLQQLGANRFKTIKWATSIFGVGQSIDGRLYTVNNGSATLLKVPFSYDEKSVDFDVAPNGDIYVSHGTNIYMRGKTGNFKNIYTSSSPKPTLAAANDKLALSESRYGANGNDTTRSLLTIISTSGKKSIKKIEAERVFWSPSGKYFITVNETNPSIYDASLNQITILPTNSVVGQIKWLSDGSVLYSTSSGLWKYNLPAKSMQLLTDVQAANTISGIYPDNSQFYIYMTCFDSLSNNSIIKRIGLKNQNISNNINGLESILPEATGAYTIGLINFAPHPSIIVRPNLSPLNDNYIQKAQSDLANQGINISQFGFQPGLPIIKGD